MALLTIASCNSNNYAEKANNEESKESGANAAGQDVATEHSINSIITAGYSVLDTTCGDLNLDAYTDMVLVLKKNGEDTTSDVIEHPEKRPLLLLLGNEDGGLTLAARNDNTVYCVDCGGIMGDPFTGITIKNGYFSVEHYGGSAWRWEKIITYKYSAADKYWYLYKIGSASFNVNDERGKREEKILSTKDFGNVRFDKYDIYAD